MNLMKRIFCLLLVLALTFPLLPGFAAAEESTETTAATEEEIPTATVTIKVVVSSKTLYTYTVEVGNKPVTLSNKKFITYKDNTYKYSVYTVSGKKTHSVTIPAYDGTTAWKTKWQKTISVIYTTHTHSYKPGYNRIYHWKVCECGDTTNEVRHVDPAKDADKVCTCGYAFSDNADLTTLWFANMQLSPRFTKETTEYVGEVITYMDVTSTSITARSFDALATIQLPEDLTIHEGANKFEILVTAEDKTATKTYTVIAVKPVKVDNILLGSDGESLSVSVKAPVKQQTASASLTEAAEEKLLELAAADGCTQIILQPDFSKWGAKQAELTLTGTLLTAVAQDLKADLLVETPYDLTLTIPADSLATLAQSHETVTIRIGKDSTFSLQADGKDIPVPEAVTLTQPEA